MGLCKVLVVEPDPVVRESIDDILTTLDCEYEIAYSIEQACKMLERGDHDLVLPAFDMPSRGRCKRRPANGEHFMAALGRIRSGNMPKVIMIIKERPITNLDMGRWTADMCRLGMTDLVSVPLPDEGRTLDRVIKKVMTGNEDMSDKEWAKAMAKPIAPSGSPNGTPGGTLSQPKYGTPPAKLADTSGTLTEMQLNILEAVAKSLHQTMLQADIIAAGGYGKHATRGCLQQLEQLGLIDHPQGERKGVAVTQAGKSLLATAQRGDGVAGGQPG